MAQTIFPPRLTNLALLELNGLILVSNEHNSVRGKAFEVLTQNGKNCICHGDNREETVKKAVEWLEARAVLTGVPMKSTQTAAAGVWSNALFAEQKRDSQLTNMLQKMKDSDVHDLKKLPPYDPNV